MLSAIGRTKVPVPQKAGGKPSSKGQNFKNIQIGILTQMSEVIQAGLDAGAVIVDPKTGKQILNVGRILELLRDLKEILMLVQFFLQYREFLKQVQNMMHALRKLQLN